MKPSRSTPLNGLVKRVWSSQPVEKRIWILHFVMTSSDHSLVGYDFGNLEGVGARRGRCNWFPQTVQQATCHPAEIVSDRCVVGSRHTGKRLWAISGDCGHSMYITKESPAPRLVMHGTWYGRWKIGKYLRCEISIAILCQGKDTCRCMRSVEQSARNLDRSAETK